MRDDSKMTAGVPLGFVAWLLSSLLGLGSAAAAEPRVLKLASVSPEGTLWARELKATAQSIQDDSGGGLRLKLYLGAVAGDETEVSARIGRDQLDGAASAGVMCYRVSPTLRALSLPGLFASRDEAQAVSERLRPVMIEEAQAAGFQLLAVAMLGQDVLFTRTPVRSLGDLRALKLWRWEGDDAAIAAARAMGLQIVPTPVLEAASAIESGRVDGLMAIPTGALSFQWATRTKFLTTLRVGHLNGCILVANRTFDRLSIEQQQLVRKAMAKLAVRFEESSRRDDEALLGGLFARQGMTLLAPTERFRSDFFAAAARARGSLDEALVARAVLARVLDAIDSYRAAHPAGPGRR